MVQVVAIGGDVLLRQGKHIGQAAGGSLHDIQQIIADLQDIAFLDGGGDGKATGVDDPVALGGVHHQDGVQLGGDFGLVHLGHVQGRTHEGYRLMGLGGSIGAYMGGNEHISFQIVAFHLHIQQFCSQGQGHQSAIAIGDKTGHFRTGAQAAQTAQQADGGGCAALALAVFAGDAHLHHIGGAFGTGEHLNFHIGVRLDGAQVVSHLLAAGGAAVQDIIDLSQLFEKHSFFHLSFWRILQFSPHPTTQKSTWQETRRFFAEIGNLKARGQGEKGGLDAFWIIKLYIHDLKPLARADQVERQGPVGGCIQSIETVTLFSV